MSNTNFSDDDVKTESSWTGPLRVLIIVLILSAAFLYYYFGPSVEDIQGNNPRASASDLPINISIAERDFVIPENYTQFWACSAWRRYGQGRAIRHSAKFRWILCR